MACVVRTRKNCFFVSIKSCRWANLCHGEFWFGVQTIYTAILAPRSMFDLKTIKHVSFLWRDTHTFKENKKKVFMKLLLIFLGNLFKSSSNDTSWYLIAAPNFAGDEPSSLLFERSEKNPTLPMLLGGAPPLRWPQENSSKTWGGNGGTIRMTVTGTLSGYKSPTLETVRSREG